MKEESDGVAHAWEAWMAGAKDDVILLRWAILALAWAHTARKQLSALGCIARDDIGAERRLFEAAWRGRGGTPCPG